MGTCIGIGVYKHKDEINNEQNEVEKVLENNGNTSTKLDCEFILDEDKNESFNKSKQVIEKKYNEEKLQGVTKQALVENQMIKDK